MPYRKHFKKDKVLTRLVREQGAVTIVAQKRIYLQLCFSIISQQLSTKVASVIQERFLALFTTNTPSAATILSKSIEELRAVGLSYSKAQYIHNVCSFFVANQLTDTKLHKMSNDEVIQLLTQIKGVGKWTVEMILMFSLGREDVFSIQDLGLQKAIVDLYGFDVKDKKLFAEKLLTLSNSWSPYRTYAALHLWKHIDS